MFRGNLLSFISCVAVVTAFECGQRVEPARQKRIVNGYEAAHWPWTVLIREDCNGDDSFDKSCGGSVIGSRWVLTAKHCVQNMSVNSIRLTFGEADVRDIDNDKSMVHRDAVSFTMYEKTDENRFRAERIFDVVPNDVAIIELDRPLDFTEHIRPICLPSSIDSIYEKGAELVTIGHGDTRPFNITDEIVDSDVLQEIKFFADKPAQCKERLLIALEEIIEKEKAQYGDFDHMALLDEEVQLNICTTEKSKVEGTCPGDSGSPLMLKTNEDERWFQFGINSFGTTDECGDPAEVEVYASVVKYCEFIAMATHGEVACIDVKAYGSAQ